MDQAEIDKYSLRPNPEKVYPLDLTKGEFYGKKTREERMELFKELVEVWEDNPRSNQIEFIKMALDVWARYNKSSNGI